MRQLETYASDYVHFARLTRQDGVLTIHFY